MSTLGIVLLVVLIALLAGAFPGWSHGGFGYGYRPFGVLGLILIVVLILVLTGRL